MKTSPRGRAAKETTVIAVRLPLETANELRALARDSYNGSMAAAVSGLLHASGGLSGLGNEDAGYNAGLRRALHDAKVALRDALTPLWKK